MPEHEPQKRGWMNRFYRGIINPPADDQLDTAINRHDSLIPTLWLLGKTGAGKSAIVQKLTQQNRAVVGNGFEPCTQTASIYEYPVVTPVIRFLDTRGLAESDYDPVPDLNTAQQSSHALLAVMRVDDSEQSSLLDALEGIQLESPEMPILVVHSALHEIPSSHERDRVITHHQNLVERRIKRTLAFVAIDFTQPEDQIEPHDRGLDDLIDAIVNLMPELFHVAAARHQHTDEQRQFERLRTQVYWYAGVAAATDTLPAIGLVTVPGIQGKMLHSLAQQFNINWTTRHAAQLLGALGTSFLYRYALSMGGRQLAKLIPVYGQSAGAAAAASVSFISTFALGRAACKYLYAKQMNLPIEPESIKQLYRDVMQSHKQR